MTYDFENFKTRLQTLQGELQRTLGSRGEIVIQGSPDALDEVQYAIDRDLTIRRLDREAALLREVNAALERIDDGSFGQCLDCDQAISLKRLKALPWASLCLECREKRDLAARLLHANRTSLRRAGDRTSPEQEHHGSEDHFSLTNLGYIRVSGEPW